MNNLIDVNYMLTNIAMLAVFKNFLNNELCVKFVVFLESIRMRDEFSKVAELYSDFVSGLYNSEFKGDWSSCVRDFVLADENPVSKEFSKNKKPSVPDFVMGAFEYELRILSDIASVTFEDVRELLLANFPQSKEAGFINSIPSFDSYKLLFTKDQIQASYKTSGFGIISKYSAFKLNSSLELTPVLNQDDISLNDLKLYDYQKRTVIKNTLAFLRGYGANNILLYGDRGCGKSSLVKAIANEYKTMGLKIIQVRKDNICLLEDVYEFLAQFPSKFIIFADDLVFDENDPLFASSKAVLEGSLAKHPDNVIIYATSNRRHLVKESFSAREGDEIHLNDTMDESASLSDRFGLTITFSSPDKNNYLSIVKQIADSKSFKYDEKKLFAEAEKFALMKGNRAPRIAQQFIKDYMAESAT